MQLHFLIAMYTESFEMRLKEIPVQHLFYSLSQFLQHKEFIYLSMYLFIYLFIYLRICTSSTGAKTIGHKSPTRLKYQPNPHLKILT